MLYRFNVFLQRTCSRASGDTLRKQRIDRFSCSRSGRCSQGGNSRTKEYGNTAAPFTHRDPRGKRISINSCMRPGANRSASDLHIFSISSHSSQAAWKPCQRAIVGRTFGNLRLPLRRLRASLRGPQGRRLFSLDLCVGSLSPVNLRLVSFHLKPLHTLRLPPPRRPTHR